ncbi:related to Phosphatidylinositol-3,4,5-trisphosphate 3-phosphatase PTEN [Ustilago trichophora]|uniref:phosphatidylinositol-3,4,5-trisphosphate 3-phosphatase n=1 Tax=Ustilago trichophora TaxID=86804 RepID=A0A5C3EHG1_9BASI|nr:related to Phosphatidylinositol-3,4,5-trisphosphate 3-phosphatase PTEN [Ustilago trichophora]
MTSIARRIVSGQKARFKDPLLDLDLDLTYVTDHIIIMGFPASGVQSLYRNKRSDVRRFLDKRHDDLYRVYNFCPVTEKSYDAEEFYGRVSRFPFPDHHVPPLSLIPLFVADITEYLESDPDATAVIHCKAGKGRSGTMTCCYLVSLPYLPTAPTSIKNYSKMQRPPNQSTTPPLATIASTDDRQQQQQQISTQTQQHALQPLDEHSPQPPARSSSMTLQLPRSAAWANINASSTDASDVPPSASGTLRRKPSLAPEQSIIRNDDHDPEVEIQQISQRLQTIFDLHTERRMKPQPKTVGRKRARSNAAGLRPSAHSTGAMPSAAASTVSLRALGAGPAGRSCDALHMSAQGANGFSNTSLHSRYATHSRASTSMSQNFDPRYSQDVSTSMIDASSNYAGIQDDDDGSVAVNQNTEDHSDTKKPKMGVSIPSQRRWVGYWTRILSGRDARLSMTSTVRQPRRQIRITRISVERRDASHTKGSQGWLERLVPHSDSLSVQLVRYEDALVDRLESWERHARRRAKAFGQHDPSGLAGDLDAEQQQQKQYLKTLRRKASDLQCWDGNKFGEEHETKIGNWGVCVNAEAERARAFDWRDDQPQLKYFTLLPESQPRVAIDGCTDGKGKEKMWKYTFEPQEESGKGRHSSTSSADSGYYSSSGPSPSEGNGGATWNNAVAPEARSNHLAPPAAQSNTDASKSTQEGPLRRMTRKASGIFSRPSPSDLPRKASPEEITPPSSTAYLPNTAMQSSSSSSTTSPPLFAGQVLDADREVCVKVLVGRTGSKHAKLPDIASAGWCWFIPSFEDPDAGVAGMARVGARTKIRFDKDEIDFRKEPLGLVAVEVEWEWVSVGVDEEEECPSDDGHY